MTRQTSSAPRNDALDKKEKVVRLIRIMGISISLFAGAIYFNLGGISDVFGFDAPTRKLVVTALLFVGLMDLVLIPRVLNLVKTK